MSAIIDGFELKFVSRLRKAERRHNGQLIDTIPVTWANSWRQGSAVPDTAPPLKSSKQHAAPTREAFVEVWWKDVAEMQARKADPLPFVVALAMTKPDGEKAEKFAEFRGVFEVAATGVELSPNSLETKVIRRMKPSADA